MKSDILIIGTGLIGGSLGLALKDSPLVNHIYGYDPNQRYLKTALKIGAIDEIATLAFAASRADIIFICSPLSFYKQILNEIIPFLKPNTIITDVGSTKEKVMDLFADLPENVWGIGGHPMAGSEIQGISGADQYLFENAVYLITPGKAPAKQVDRLMALIEGTGAKTKILDAQTHDELVAIVSHIPHLSAVALVNLTGGDSEHLSLAAGGFRDTTRIASSNPELWEDILLFNRTYILKQLDEFTVKLKEMRESIRAGDRAELLGILHQAKDIRDKIPQAKKGLIPSYHDVVCIVPDEPGIIGKLGKILGEKDINIVDIEILRVREGDGGTIRLGVPNAILARQAADLLLNNDIKAWVR